MPARGGGAAVARGSAGAIPVRERRARVSLAQTSRVICTRLGGVVARSISMRPREVEATARARAWLSLTLVPGLGPGRARRLAEHAGGPEAACALGPRALASAGIEPAIVAAWSAAPRRAAREVGRLGAGGGRGPAWGPRGPRPRAARRASWYGWRSWARRCARGTIPRIRRACAPSPSPRWFWAWPARSPRASRRR